MSVMPVPKLIQSLRNVLQQVDSQTSDATPLGDSTTKQTYVDWITTAKTTRNAAKKLTPELQKVEHFELALKYRTKLLSDEAKFESDPLVQHFMTLSEELFPKGIPADFAEKQLRHLCKNYPSFAQKLLDPDHKELAIEFFKFCLQAPSQSSHREKRTEDWVDIFIKYPEIAEYLMQSSLYEILGLFPDLIKIDSVKGGVAIKMDTVEGVKYIRINLSDKSAGVTLKTRSPDGSGGGRFLSFEEMGLQFKGDSPPDFDVSMEGIINLNTTLLGTRGNEKKVIFLDPKKWTEHKPYVELTWPELQAFLRDKAQYPKAQEDFSSGLVIRAYSYSPPNSQAFFYFVMKDPRGIYRVFSLGVYQKPSSITYQQTRTSSTFTPLTDQQVELIKAKVAEDIEHSRKAHAEGKPIPPLDVQSYVDGVLGHAFYANIESLINSRLFPTQDEKTKRINELTQARQNLDTAAFEKVIRPIIDMLITNNEIPLIHTFIETSLSAIYSVLPKGDSKIYLPTKDEIIAAAQALHTTTGNIDKMSPSLVALGSLCFEVLHPSRMTVAAAEKDTLVLGRLFRIVESIPWVWIKNLLSNFLLLVLGPIRGYRYKTLVPGNQGRLKKLFQAVKNLKPEKYINRPSQFFESLSPEHKKAIEKLIKEHLTVLAKPITPAQVPPPPVVRQSIPDLEGDMFASTISPPPGFEAANTDH